MSVGVLALASIAPAWGSGSSIHLRASKGTVDRAWRPDTSGGPYCTPALQGEQQCDYIAGSVHVSVGYTHGTATEFVAWGFSNPAGRSAWSFLTSLLPKGARKVACRYIPKTGGNYGPAHACIYRSGKHQDLAAQYLKPSDPQTQGQVDADQGFDYITAAG